VTARWRWRSTEPESGLDEVSPLAELCGGLNERNLGLTYVPDADWDSQMVVSDEPWEVTCSDADAFEASF
jgi:hypothetical protein